MIKIITSGKRKRAVARAILTEGKGNITINKKSYKILHSYNKLKIEEPLKITESLFGKIDFDVAVTVIGGGVNGQIEAAGIALSRAIVEFKKSEELRKNILAYDKHLLIADVRRKETYKPGDSKARRKRQKSYR